MDAETERICARSWSKSGGLLLVVVLLVLVVMVVVCVVGVDVEGVKGWQNELRLLVLAGLS